MPEDVSSSTFMPFAAVKRAALFPQPTPSVCSFLTTLAEFSVTIDELRAPTGSAQNNSNGSTGSLRRWRPSAPVLPPGGLFYPPFEATRFADLTPGDGEFFIGLPLMTPYNERFFSRIPKDRLLVDALFAPTC